MVTMAACQSRRGPILAQTSSRPLLRRVAIGSGTARKAPDFKAIQAFRRLTSSTVVRPFTPKVVRRSPRLERGMRYIVRRRWWRSTITFWCPNLRGISRSRPKRHRSTFEAESARVSSAMESVRWSTARHTDSIYTQMINRRVGAALSSLIQTTTTPTNLTKPQDARLRTRGRVRY
jgi:hypothetical protein